MPMRFLRLLSFLVVCGALVGLIDENRLAASDQILVEVFELPNGQVWPTPSDLATEKFNLNAMSLPVMPRRYSEEGVIVDRKAPFVVRLSVAQELPAAEYEFLLRAMNQSRLLIDGKTVATTLHELAHNDGHNEVPKLAQLMRDLRILPPGHDEKAVRFRSSGATHQLVVEAIIGGTKKRPETGELSVSIRSMEPTDDPFVIVSGVAKLGSGGSDLQLTDLEWERFVAAESNRIGQLNRARRYDSDQRKAYWSKRHEQARQYVASMAPLGEAGANKSTTIDGFVRSAMKGSSIPPAVNDHEFLRRLALDTVGVVPTVEEVEAYFADSPDSRRSAAVARYLSDDRWADHWVSYWQDVLAENPGILKPKLNNTGPFRWWIYESFLDNKPIDRFVTELIMMRGSHYAGGPAGFSMATQNDVPMAAKAHVLGQAFLGIQMKCARCHDSPQHDLRQEELFSLAAMLGRSAIKVPQTSSISGDDEDLEGLAVRVTLKPGSEVQPVWPFENIAEMSADLPSDILENDSDTRAKLAAIITSYSNQRFAQVIVNRVWQRLLGRGIVDSVDDWEHATNHAPDLLDHLARQLVANRYDLKHVTSLILNSRAYQAETTDGQEHHLLPVRRRLSAEQIVDSLFTVSGKSFKSEALNLDIDGQRPVEAFLNLGTPRRAWEFTSLSNERDRPALAMPHAQSVVDMLLTFGWRDSRQDPITTRDPEPTVQQPGILANSILVQRTTCLSDDNLLTELCHSATSVEQVVDGLFLQILSRPPTEAERLRITPLLEDGFSTRVTASTHRASRPRRHAVSWSNHLNAEATRIKLELERQVQKGDPPTETLVRDWRERVEDVAWSLVNSPEFVFVP
jgi:hypothetical protein